MVKTLLVVIDVVDFRPGVEPTLTAQKINVSLPFTTDVASKDVRVFLDLAAEALDAMVTQDRATVSELFPEAF